MAAINLKFTSLKRVCDMLQHSLSLAVRGCLINLKNNCYDSDSFGDSICVSIGVSSVHIKQQLSLIIVVAVFSRRCLCSTVPQLVCKAVAPPADPCSLPPASLARLWACGQLAFSQEQFLFARCALSVSLTGDTHTAQHTHYTRYDTSKTRHEQCVSSSPADLLMGAFVCFVALRDAA